MPLDMTISYILRLLLAFVFLRAMLHKLGNYQHFKVQLEAYELLPGPLLTLFAPALIVLEGYLAITLLVGGSSYPSYIAATVLALYAAAMGINLVRGREDLDCGCAGPAQVPQRIAWALVIRNGVLALLALATAGPVASREWSAQDISTVVFASIAVVLVYASIEQAIANQQRQREFLAHRGGKQREAAQ